MEMAYAIVKIYTFVLMSVSLQLQRQSASWYWSFCGTVLGFIVWSYFGALQRMAIETEWIVLELELILGEQ